MMTMATADDSDASTSLFQECVAMWGGSVSAPAATNIRILAKEGKLSEEDASRVLTLPVSYETVVDVFLKNKELLLKEFSSDKGIPYHIDVLSELHKYVQLDESELVIFDDEYRDSELVYAIAINRTRKKITLVFRGSVSKKDYEVDFAVIMKGVPNPFQNESKRMKIHSGYLEYLNGKGQNGNSKFDEIVNHLKSLLADHPDYSIYVAGHSLGGSLANLLTFQLAGVSEIPFPINCITFGALLIGDVRFRRAFQTYERMKRIRCINVVNDGDVIPLLPPQGYLTSYVHIGTKLWISTTKKAKLSRDPESRCLFGAYVKNVPSHVLHWLRLFDVICCTKDFSDNHTVLAYSKSLTSKQVEEELKKLTVDEVSTPDNGFVRTAM